MTFFIVQLSDKPRLSCHKPPFNGRSSQLVTKYFSFLGAFPRDPFDLCGRQRFEKNLRNCHFTFHSW